MKLFFPLASVALALLLAGCNTPKTAYLSSMPGGAAGLVEIPTIETSLFSSDQAVLSDEAVKEILSSRLELPAKARLAVMKFPGSSGSRHYGSYYWRDERYLKLQRTQTETISEALLRSENIAEVTPLPSLMTPSKVSIPVLREAAVRLQADMLLVFRITSDTYSQYRAFAKDKTKAYSTCELVLLDVRTGLVPFARVTSRERLEIQKSTDLDVSETMRRAEEAAAMDALNAATSDLAAFITAAPKKVGGAM